MAGDREKTLTADLPIEVAGIFMTGMAVLTQGLELLDPAVLPGSMCAVGYQKGGEPFNLKQAAEWLEFSDQSGCLDLKCCIKQLSNLSELLCFVGISILFVDRYWQFSAGRKWASRKGQAAKAGPAPAATAQTQAQLDGLRRKAAFRQQQARQSQQAEAPHQAEASPAGADLGTPAPAAGAVQAEAADRESVHAPQARPSPQQPSTSSHHMAHGMPASCSSNPSAPGQNDAPVDTSQRHAATYVEMSWAAAHQSKASSDVVAAPAPHKSAMQQPAAAGSAALQSSGPGQPDQGFSSPDWVEGSLEARLRMLSLDLLHINLHLRAIAPGTELWRSQAVPGDTPVRSSDSQQNSSMVTEVGSQAEESTCGPPPRSADDLQIQPSINASREEGRGSNESDRPRQFLGSLNGLDNVQSQLAGLRRKVARRPADVE